MPNWCHNRLRIAVSNPDERDAILAAMRDIHKESGEMTPFSFQKIVPMPESEKDNWYEWRIRNWGCKWDLVPSEIHWYYTNRSIWFEFETPWSPPLEVVAALSKRFPTNYMRIDFEEKGMAMSGNVMYQAGFVLLGSRARMGRQPIQLV